MPIFAALALAFKVWMITDAMRRRVPQYWFFVIIMPFGDVAYFLSTVLPDLSQKGPGILPFGQKAPKLSLAELRRLVKESPTIDNKKRLAKALVAERSTSEARELLDQVLKFDGRDREALFLLAETFAAERNREAAIEELTKIVALDPSWQDFTAVLYISELYAEAGNREKQIEALRLAHTKQPSVKHKVVLAEALMNDNQLSAARELLEEALSDFRQSPAHVKKRNRTFAGRAKHLLPRVS